METQSSEIIIRGGRGPLHDENGVLIREGDIGFITKFWLKSFRNASFVKGVPNSVYYGYHHKILEELIPRSTVLVCANKEDDTLIYGFMCAELFDEVLVVHYAYTKEQWRGKGLQTAMLDQLKRSPDEPVLYTHKTPSLYQFPDRQDIDSLAKESYAQGEASRPRATFNDRDKYPRDLWTLEWKLSDGKWVYDPYVLFTSLPKNWENEES